VGRSIPNEIARAIQMRVLSVMLEDRATLFATPHVEVSQPLWWGERGDAIQFHE
jgi:hypothetical protein